MNKTKILLIIIALISFVIRIYNSSYPPLLWDEASLGYNAYSILKTGKDEYGVSFPLIFKSFGDYKPGFYVYLTVPFVAVFGLSELSVRLPSIIAGSLLPLLLYLLIVQINPKSKSIALFSAFVLALNPYNIHYSRNAWETNLLTLELVLASLFFFQKKYFWSSLVFGLSLFTYQAGKMISLLLISSLLIVNFNILKHHTLPLFTKFFLPLFIISLPVIFGLLFSNNANRLKVVSLFSYPRSVAETQTIISESNRLDYQIFHGHSVFFVRNFISRYFNHFSPKFLTFEGDWQNPRHSAPYVGVLLFPSIIFLILGIFSNYPKKDFSHLRTFFLFWLILAPVPSALTRDSIQATRSMSLSIPLVFFTGLGLHFFLKKFPHISLRLLCVGIYLISFIYYFDLYLNHMVKRSPHDFLYGYKQAAAYVHQHQHDFDHVYFSDFYGQPYIYYLFYSKYDPKSYQSQAILTENQVGDTGRIENIDKIRFSPSADPSSLPPSSLAIYTNDELLRKNLDPQNFIPLSPINGISTFYAYQKK